MILSKTRLTLALTWIAVIVSCVLMLASIHTSVSRPGTSLALSYALYAVIGVILALSLFYAFNCKRSVKAICIGGESKRLASFSMLLSAGLFYDFVHQCYNCYNYFENVGYIEYAYIVPIALSGLFALLSTAYFTAFLLSVRETGVDYRRFTVFHLMPLLWAFFKVFILITDIFDVTRSVQDICNFILSVSIISFFMTFVSASDKKEKPASRAFIASSVFSASMCFIVSVPRLLAVVFGVRGLMEAPAYSSVTYLMLGLFIVTLLKENRKCERENVA